MVVGLTVQIPTEAKRGLLGVTRHPLFYGSEARHTWPLKKMDPAAPIEPGQAKFISSTSCLFKTQPKEQTCNTLYPCKLPCTTLQTCTRTAATRYC